MRRAAALSVLLASTAGIAALPSTASAAVDLTLPKVVSVNGPSSAVVLKAVGKSTLIVRVRVTDNVGVTAVKIGLDDVGSVYKSILGFNAERISGSAKDGVWELKLTTDRTEAVGGWTIRAFAADAAGNISLGYMKIRDTFQVKYRTRVLNFNGSPEPVADGAAAKFTGQLDRVSANGWTDAANRTVALQFRKQGTSTWVTRKTQETDANGGFSFKARVNDPGAWRAVFAGTATLAPSVSVADAIALS